MGTSDLPNMYAQSLRVQPAAPWAAGIHIRQIKSACGTAIMQHFR